MRSPTSSRVFLSILGSVVALGLLLWTSSSSAERDNHRMNQEQEHHGRRHGMDKIKHIVFIVKENRTFDNDFGTFAGADGATTGTISTGEVIPLGHAPDRTPRDIDHSYQA